MKFFGTLARLLLRITPTINQAPTSSTIPEVDLQKKNISTEREKIISCRNNFLHFRFETLGMIRILRTFDIPKAPKT